MLTRGPSSQPPQRTGARLGASRRRGPWRAARCPRRACAQWPRSRPARAERARPARLPTATGLSWAARSPSSRTPTRRWTRWRALHDYEVHLYKYIIFMHFTSKIYQSVMEWIESAIKWAPCTNKYTARHTISVPAGNGQAGKAPDSRETIRVRVPIGAIFTRHKRIQNVSLINVALRGMSWNLMYSVRV